MFAGLVLTLIQVYAEFDGDVHLPCFEPGILFLVKFGPKIKSSILVTPSGESSKLYINPHPSLTKTVNV